MKVLFLDTNIFLQCRNLEQIPWENVIEGRELFLLITSPVIDEIDKFKHEGNTRRATRAKKAIPIFRQLGTLKSDQSITIRDSEPSVRLSLFHQPLHNRNDIPDDLDLSRIDNLIIAEALLYRKSNPGEDVALLTYDTNPILTAKRYGLPFIEIPEDWLLPPEPDPQSKKIAELERQIKEFGLAQPKIVIVGEDKSGNVIKETLSISIVKYEQLTESQIKNLLETAQMRFPMTTDFITPPGKLLIKGLINDRYQYQYEPPSEHKIKKYQDEDYPNWITKLKHYFKLLPSNLESPNRHIDLSIYISNIGRVPSKNTHLEFKCRGDILLTPPQKDDDKNKGKDLTQFPLPPLAPEGNIVIKNEVPSLGIPKSYLAMQEHLKRTTPAYVAFLPEEIRPLPFSLTELQHDRYAFYWKDSRPSTYTDHRTFTCDEFRHQVEPESFSLPLFVPPTETIENCSLEVRVTAANLPEPFKVHFPIKITYSQGDIFKRAEILMAGGIFIGGK